MTTKTQRKGWAVMLLEGHSKAENLQSAWDDCGEWHSPSNPKTAFLENASILALFRTKAEAMAFGKAEFDYQMGPSWTVVNVTITVEAK